MNPNTAIKKALSSNRVKSTIADLGDIDFSILSENNPFDTAPAVKSGFNEASAGWGKYQPSSREVEAVVTQPATTMVNPVVVANAADDALQLRKAQLGAALKALADGSANSPVAASSRMQLAINSGLGDELWNGAPALPPTRVETLDMGVQYPPQRLGEEWKGVVGADSTLPSKTASQSSPVDYADPQHLKLIKDMESGNKDAILAGRELWRHSSSFQKLFNELHPDGLPTRGKSFSSEEVAASTPFYRQPAVMYGGLGLAGLGGAALAYNAFSAPPEEEPQPVYQAPAYGQMPRSFR